MEKKKSFFNTIPGILTGAATLITAIGGLILIIKKNPSNSIQDDTNKSGIVINNSSVQNIPKKIEKDIDKIIGQWNFILHSDISGNTLKGNINIAQNLDSGENLIKGQMNTFNSDWNNFSSNISGILKDNILIISRDTGINGIIQNYEVTVYSKENMSGSFHNSDISPTYNDKGSISFTR